MATEDVILIHAPQFIILFKYCNFWVGWAHETPNQVEVASLTIENKQVGIIKNTDQE